MTLRAFALLNRLVPALVAAVLSVGCTDGGGDVGVWQHRIKDGEPDNATTTVVGFFHLGAQTLCTGSLIAPNIVLTARHCVARTKGGLAGIGCEGYASDPTQFGGLYDTPGFRVSFDQKVDPAKPGLLVDAVLIDPDATSDFCGNDIALLQLSEPQLDRELMPIRLAPDDVAVVDEVYTAVGYGGVDNSGGASAMAGERRRRENITVSCSEEGCPDELPTLEGEWGGTGYVCQGDSGGPAIDSMGRVFGVASRGTQDCSQSIYASTVGSSTWIKDAVVAASGAGLYDPPAWTAGSTVDRRETMPVGDTCQGAGDCPSGICQPDPAGNFCSRPCSTEAPCPGSFVCGGESAVCERFTPPVYQSPPDREDCSYSGGAPHQPKGPPATAFLFALALGLWLGRRSK